MTTRRVPTVDPNGKILEKNLPSRLSDANIKEAVQDALADMLARGSHTGISFVYNDDANSLSASVSGATGSSGGGTGPDTTPPTAPSSLAATRTSATSASLSWGAATDNVAVTGYRVFRANIASGVTGTYAELTSTIASTRAYTDTSISATSSYSYQVRAFDAAGNISVNGAVSTIGVQPANATAPSTVTNIAATGSGAQQITVSWAAPVSNGGSAITGYLVSRDGTNAAGTGPTTSPLQSATATTYTFTNLVGGQSYNFSVVARNAIGDSSPVTITATAPSTVQTGPGAASLDDALFTYSGTWVATDTEHYSGTAGVVASAQVTIGVGGGTLSITGTKDVHHGDMGVKIDSGAEVIVGCYATSRTTGTNLYTSGSLTAGTHTVTVRVVGSSSTGGSGSTIALDTMTTTNGTFQASGATGGSTGGGGGGTGGSSTTSPSTVDNPLLAYSGSWQTTDIDSYSSVTGDTASIGVSIGTGGGTVTVYGTQNVHHGIAGVSVDGGTEVSADFYAPARATAQAIYTTPTLSAGSHTIKIRVTGDRNQASTSTVVAIDYLSTTNGTFTTPQSPSTTSDSSYTFSGTWSDNGADTTSTTVSATAQININIAAGGGSVSLTGYRGPSAGIAGVKLDSNSETNADLYASSSSNSAFWTSGTLTTGQHTIVVRVTGSKNGSSTGTTISVSGATTTNGTFSKPTTTGAGGGTGGTVGFMTRSGTQLKLNGATYKGVGFNTFGITGCTGGGYSDSVMASYYASMRANTITRTWGFKNYGIDALATVVRQAEAAGQMLIVALADGVNYCGENEGGGSGGSGKPASWYQGGYKTGGYLNWVQQVVTRFKDSKAIAGWEYANEEIGQSGQTLYNFYTDVGNVIKNIDNNHLIWSGQRAEYDFGDGATGYKLAHSAAPIDCCSLHEYDWDYNNSHQIISGHWNACRTAATQLNKVAYVGEVGINGTTGSGRVTEFQKKWAGYLGDGGSAVLMWAAKRNGDSSGLNTYEFSFSDPLFAAQKAYTPPT